VAVVAMAGDAFRQAAANSYFAGASSDDAGRRRANYEPGEIGAGFGQIIDVEDE